MGAEAAAAREAEAKAAEDAAAAEIEEEPISPLFEHEQAILGVSRGISRDLQPVSPSSDEYVSEDAYGTSGVESADEVKVPYKAVAGQPSSPSGASFSDFEA